jgi:hypothetical protein
MTTITVAKGIKINDDTNGNSWELKRLPRGKNGKVSVHGIPCQRINQGD